MYAAHPILVCAAATNIAWLAGCAGQARPEKVDRDVWDSPHFGTVRKTEEVVAAEGLPPLVFQLQQPVTVRIVDETTGKQIATAAGQTGDIVAVDASSGIHVGGRPVAGIITADHRHAIHLDFEPPPSGPPAGETVK
ncbi:MAG TPA: hypothetical protein VG269_16645 [Tepidisphaeraceae bacterium]|jgi:hypothetical protein|nr:hypothetical protein [Tepidisphaeraceae bacterium]